MPASDATIVPLPQAQTAGYAPQINAAPPSAPQQVLQTAGYDTAVPGILLRRRCRPLLLRLRLKRPSKFLRSPLLRAALR
ncbi:MAG: hypothetical protein QM775_14805 [Pirellulales bacterium]